MGPSGQRGAEDRKVRADGITRLISNANRSILGPLIVVTLSLIAAITAGELFVRKAGIAAPDVARDEPNPLYGWRHIPDHVWRIDGPEGSVIERINKNGLRGPELQYDKSPGVFRILIVGDSMVEGNQVPEEMTFSAQLERALNDSASERRFEVLNAGVGGYGTDNELLFYQHEGLKYRPDLVVLAFCEANDVYDNSQTLVPVGSPGKPPKPYFDIVGGRLRLLNFPCNACVSQDPETTVQRVKIALRKHSAVYSLARRAIVQQLPALATLLAAKGFIGKSFLQASHMETAGVPLLFLNFAKAPDSDWKQAWEVTALLLHRFQDVAVASGAKFLVVGIPIREQIHDSSWESARRHYPGLNDDSWDRDQADRMISAAAATASTDYLSVAREFKDRGRTEQLFFQAIDEAHMNVAGHALLAQLVKSAIVARGYVKTSSNP